MKNGTVKNILIIGCGTLLGSLAASGVKLLGTYVAGKIAMKRLTNEVKDTFEELN